ncbi:MAG: zinc dependent phospholipase C family protein [Omnitrophica WOR_2 bacterium]
MRLVNFVKKIRLNTIILIFCTPILISWGTIGHENINRLAVLCIPKPLVNFFYNHIDFMVTASSVPDMRRYALEDKSEVPKHFIDLENFGPLDSIPFSLHDAQRKYGKDFLQKNGILPWCIEETMNKLTKAFKEKRKNEILFLAADLGHYIADAYTPLHTTVNYDGQLTSQKGIHDFWESKLINCLNVNLMNHSVKPVLIVDIHKEIWKIIQHSNSLVDSILLIDKDLRIKHSVQNDIYSKEYAHEYCLLARGMPERQMRSAANSIASYWFTAWVNAGSPDLSELDNINQYRLSSANLKKELRLLRNKPSLIK